MPNLTLPSSRTDFIDPRTGKLSREWYLFFLNLYTGGTDSGESVLVAPDNSVVASKIDELSKTVQGIETAPRYEPESLFTQAGAGAVTRTSQAKAREWVSVRDYGAVGDGVTDDGPALQAALTYGTSTGKTIFIPAGVYLCTTPLVMDDTATSVSFTGPRCNIIGDGSANTSIVYPSGTDALFTIGNSFLQYHITITGVYLEGPGGGAPGTGTALAVQNALFFSMNDVRVTGFGTGMVGTDIYNMYCANSTFAYNVEGMYLQVGTYTQPNAITFIATTFGYNSNFGLNAQLVTTMNFFGGTFQGNGIGGSGAFVGGADISMGPDGAAGCNLQGVYFEENAGDADLFIDGLNSAGCNITGCTFNRVTSAHYTTNNILTNAAAGKTVKVAMSGCGFGGFNTYTPDAARQCVWTTAGTVQYSWHGCYFRSATDEPTYPDIPNYIVLGSSSPTYSSVSDLVRGVAMDVTGSATATVDLTNAPQGGNNKWLKVTSDSVGIFGYIPIWHA